MKYYTLTAILLLSSISLATVQAQSFNRTIHKTAVFADKSDADNKFRIMNINGSVTIEAYSGDTIELTVDEEIKGNDAEIEKGKKELEYKLERRGNLILAYLDAPFISLKYEGDEIHYRVDRDKDSYRFVHNVHLRVPRGILLEGSTINNGVLAISGDFKKVKASNVNGALKLQQMTSQTRASTVNGDITVSYDKAPAKDSEYHTVNGKIEIFMPENLSADIYFESLHGDLYTDFENIQRLTPQINKKTDTTHSGTKYRVDKTSPFRIGNGGPKLRFQVLNGDVYLRKQS